ncbi:GNAT family N-acetyltransferase [Streptomyces sp. NPDC056821]|uniref:GNAT family N-acetyltransferase n=1 Tax=unclassified Streptomyces TaxID=2593676 RepID=UPI00369A767B
MTSHVDQAVAARIAAARLKREQQRQQRAELAAARAAGLVARHRAKLQRLTEDATPTHGETMTPSRILAANRVRTIPFNPRSYTHVRRITELYSAYLLEEYDRINDYAPGLPVAAHINTLVVRAGDEIAGFCSADPHACALELIYLAPEHRGRGIAAAIVTQMRQACPKPMGAKMPFTPHGQALVERTRLRPIQPSESALQDAAEQLKDINRVIRKECPHRRGNPSKACRRCYRQALRRSATHIVQTYLAEQRKQAA